jgi:isoquinoline 1-oxidoreductase beta subunit
MGAEALAASRRGLGGKRLSADYRVPFLAHAAMEPMVAVARVADGRAEIWGPTQSLTLAHWAVAEALGLETDAVTIHPTLVGGGFGRKAEADAMVEAALIARATGKPVLLQWSRGEDLAAGRFRPPAAARMEAGLAEDGSITDWTARIAVPSVSASFAARVMPRFAPDPASASDGAIEGAAEIPYAVGAFAAEHVAIVQPVPLGFWRSVGHSFSAFFVESFVDELAAEAGIDPLAYRLHLLDGKPRLQRVLKAAADAGQWAGALPAGIGRGIALHESFGSIVATVVEAGVADGGIRIRRLASAIDCGRAINPDSVRAQVEGGALMGLSAALGEGMGFAGGMAEARNFDGYPLLSMRHSPEVVTTTIVESGEALGGVGEPGTPPAAPALANALFAATGKRARTLPLLAQFL